MRRWSSIDRFPLREVLPPGSAALAAGTGTIVFATLLGRLWSGSTAATDLILWAITLACFTMALIRERPRWSPTRGQLLEIASVSVLVAVFTALNAHDLNDWYYSAIGDEYAFLAAASGVLADGIRKPFSQDGVYGAHPMLGTLFQAAIMRIVREQPLRLAVLIGVERGAGDPGRVLDRAGARRPGCGPNRDGAVRLQPLPVRVLRTSATTT